MPVRNASISAPALAVYKQLSYEHQTATWLMADGWEVFIPAIDHGAKTDLVIADDKRFYRIQVKTVESADDSIQVENKWAGSQVDYVVYYSRSAQWGYITPAFPESRRRLNHPEHIRFHQHQKPFLKVFLRI